MEESVLRIKIPGSLRTDVQSVLTRVSGLSEKNLLVSLYRQIVLWKRIPFNLVLPLSQSEEESGRVRDIYTQRFMDRLGM